MLVLQMPLYHIIGDLIFYSNYYQFRFYGNMYENETLESILGLEPENSRDVFLQNEEGSEMDFEDSYSENDENNEDMDHSKRGKAKIYLNWKRFDDKESFQKWWNEENAQKIWRRHQITKTTEYWNCKHNKRYGVYKCQMGLKILFSESVSVQIIEGDHNHTCKNPLNPLSDRTKELMKSLKERGYKPGQIHRELVVL